jgi:hypothetical protein
LPAFVHERIHGSIQSAHRAICAGNTGTVLRALAYYYGIRPVPGLPVNRRRRFLVEREGSRSDLRTTGAAVGESSPPARVARVQSDEPSPWRWCRL